MGAFFAKEIVEAAIRIEKNGLSYYRYLAEAEKRKDIREVFNYLAEEEMRHIAAFEHLAESLQEPPDHTWEREDFGLYLESLSEDSVFKDDGSGEKKAGDVKSVLEAVELGIRFEKDTILFFQELHNLVRREEHEVVDQLICWEKNHLVRLIRLKRQLQDAEKR
jgi:rubrerythrin